MDAFITACVPEQMLAKSAYVRSANSADDPRAATEIHALRWHDGSPLDPELLRFTPPQQGELGGAEPLWRPQCSLMRYLRLAVLDAGGFPGCLGLEAYEPLRLALTEGLLPF